MARNNTDWDPEDIKAEVRKRQTTLAELSRTLKLNPDACRLALRRPWPACEAAIARCIGVEPAQIWPTRYTEDGEPKGARFRCGGGRAKRSTKRSRPVRAAA